MPESVFKDFNTLGKLIDDHPVKRKYMKWEENYLYFIGEQWYVRTGDTIEDFYKRNKQKDNTTYRNKIFITVNTWASKFIEKLTPTFSMLPETTSQESRQKANISKQFAMFWWHESEYRKKTLPMLTHFFLTGNMFSKTYFDEEAFAEVDVDGKVETKKVGKVTLEFLHPRSVIYDPYSPTISDSKCRYTIEMSYIPKSEVKRLYNFDVAEGKETLPDWANNTMALFKEKYWDLREYEDEGVLRVITYEREEDFTWTEKIWISGEVRKTNKDYKNHPYNQAKDQDIGNIGEPKLEHGIQPQRDYNKIYEMMLDMLQHAPGYLYTNGELDKTVMDGGGIIHLKSQGDSGIPPTYIPGAQINPALGQILQLEDTHFNDIMFTHDHMQGKVPAGSSHMPGYIHQTLLGQDLARLGAAMVEFEEMTAQILMKAINLAIKHYTDERVMRVFGEESGLQMFKLRGNSLGVADVRVDFGSSLPITKMEKIQFLIQLVQMQVIPPDKLTDNVELGHIEKGLSDTIADSERARRQIDKIYDISYGIEYDEENDVYFQRDDSPEGKAPRTPENLVPDVFEWDNPAIQVPVVETEMKSARFEQSGKFTQEMFVILRQKLIDILQAQQQQQAPQGAPIPSGEAVPPEGGAAPPPTPEEMIAQVLAALLNGVAPEELVAQGAPEPLVQLILQAMEAQAEQIEQIRAEGGGENEIIQLLLPMIMQVLAEQEAQAASAGQPQQGV